MKGNWQKKPLNEIGEVISGGTPPTGTSEYWDGDIVWITPADLSKVKYPLIDNSLRRITRTGVLNSGATIIPRNSIVISSRAPIGYIAVPQVEFTTNQGCKSITFQQGHDPIYHYYNFIFRVNRFKNRGEGTTFAEVSKKVVEKLEFEFPPLPQQRKIARILSTCDAVIERTEAAIAKYRALKQGLMHDLFTRGIDLNTGRLRPQYEEAPELYKESALGWVPKEWEVKRLEEIGSIVTGSTPSTANRKFYDGSIPFISPADVSTSKFITVTEKKITELGLATTRQIPENSICVVCIGSTIGKIAMTTSIAATNQQINSIIPSQTDSANFLFYACKKFIIKQLSVEAGLQAVPIVNKSSFAKLLISKPVNDRELKMISDKLGTVDEKLDIEESALSKYRQLRAGLMQDLLSGKVEVSVGEELENN